MSFFKNPSEPNQLHQWAFLEPCLLLGTAPDRARTNDCSRAATPGGSLASPSAPHPTPSTAERRVGRCSPSNSLSFTGKARLPSDPLAGRGEASRHRLAPQAGSPSQMREEGPLPHAVLKSENRVEKGQVPAGRDPPGDRV